MAVGTSERFAAHYDRMAQEREIATLAAKAPLQSLTRRELQRDDAPVTISPKPQRVHAWVRAGYEPLRIVAVAEQWTQWAVGVRFTAREVEYKCWVWASAVDELPPDPVTSQRLGLSGASPLARTSAVAHPRHSGAQGRSSPAVSGLPRHVRGGLWVSRSPRNCAQSTGSSGGSLSLTSIGGMMSFASVCVDAS